MDKHIYKARRGALGRLIGESGVALIPGAGLKLRNGDVDFPFRQESNMLYLSGFPEPDAFMLILGGKIPRTIFFCAPKDPQKELWHGKRFGPEIAKTQFYFDEVYPNEPTKDVVARIVKLMDERTAVFAPEISGNSNAIFPLSEILLEHKNWSLQVTTHKLNDILGEFRLIKDEHEIRLMHHAGVISGSAHRDVLRIITPGMHEYELEAEITYRFRKAGGDPLHAYPPIVASGANACTLHYVTNNMVMHAGDLVLIDAGCEYRGYASDITRTVPVNGVFSPAQRELYTLNLDAQKAALKKARAGNTLFSVHYAAMRVLVKGFIALGLIRGHTIRSAIASGVYKQFFPHGTSHWLGSDVHDVGDYKKNEAGRLMRKLEPGMVITIEPGIYVTPSPDVPEKYWNIGIRIEDDVLITDDAPFVFSSNAPKEIDEIEALMRRPKR